MDRRRRVIGVVAAATAGTVVAAMLATGAATASMGGSGPGADRKPTPPSALVVADAAPAGATTATRAVQVITWAWADGGHGTTRTFSEATYSSNRGKLALTVRVAPVRPVRKVVLEYSEQGKWYQESAASTSAGRATVKLDPICQGGDWCDGTWRYRLRVLAASGKPGKTVNLSITYASGSSSPTDPAGADVTGTWVPEAASAGGGTIEITRSGSGYAATVTSATKEFSGQDSCTAPVGAVVLKFTYTETSGTSLLFTGTTTWRLMDGCKAVDLPNRMLLSLDLNGDQHLMVDTSMGATSSDVAHDSLRRPTTPPTTAPPTTAPPTTTPPTTAPPTTTPPTTAPPTTAPPTTAPPTTTAPTSWTGTWHTTWGTMVLTQTGSSVSGTYDTDDGRIQGTVSGKVLTGKWTEAGGDPYNTGPISFTMSADGMSFSGTYGYDGSGINGYAWNGTRG